MKYVSLYDYIRYIQKGTKLHISVLFLGNYGNEMCKLPHRHEIHSGPVCSEFKSSSKTGYKRCFWCRNLAVKKVLSTKESFGGYCINGIFEYTRPVLVDGDIACIIFIGNILYTCAGNRRINKKLINDSYLMTTLEQDFRYEDCEIIGDMLETHILLLLENCNDINHKVNPLVENIKNYIHSNLEFDIDISNIAGIFHYNKLYLGRLFKKETGISIKDYINTQRIKRAKYLLENSSDSIIYISSLVGFNNVTYFNRMFKSMVEMTPSEYRNKKRKENT